VQLLLLLVSPSHFLSGEGGREGGKGESSFIQRPSARQKLVAEQEEGREGGREGGREDTLPFSSRIGSSGPTMTRRTQRSVAERSGW